MKENLRATSDIERGQMGSLKSKLKGLFIECNNYALDEHIKDIEKELNITVDGCLLTDKN